MMLLKRGMPCFTALPKWVQLKGGALRRCIVTPITAYGGSARGMSGINRRRNDERSRSGGREGSDRPPRDDNTTDFPDSNPSSYARRGSSDRDKDFATDFNTPTEETNKDRGSYSSGAGRKYGSSSRGGSGRDDQDWDSTSRGGGGGGRGGSSRRDYGDRRSGREDSYRSGGGSSYSQGRGGGGGGYSRGGGSYQGNRRSNLDTYRQSNPREDNTNNSPYDDDFSSRSPNDRENRGSYRGDRDRSGGYNNNDGGDRGGDRRRGSTSRDAPKGPSIKDFWIADVLYGVSPVLAALQAGRRKIHTLYLQEGLSVSASSSEDNFRDGGDRERSSSGGGGGKRKDKGAVDAAIARAKELGAKIVSASKHDLNMVTDNRPHQGLVLDCSELDFESLDAMPAVNGMESGEVPLWLCLDEVMDPQNFGAALRSAFYLGATGVLTCRRNSSPLSAVVSKASAGAMELAPVHSCRSLPQTLEDAKSKGWQIIGASAEEGAVPCSTFHLTQPSILVMGNEGYGLRTTVKRQCDVLLKIGGGQGAGMAAWQGIGGTTGGMGSQLVESLNVSVATGILIHDLLASRAEAGAEGN